jgi:sporulation protein YlmC with PRC-barrel domain
MTSPDRLTPQLMLLVAALLLPTGAVAQTPEISPLLRTVPADANTVADFYRQSVYNQANDRIGRVEDLLVDKDGMTRVAILSVGGFLGLASKYVAVPFTALQLQLRERQPYLILEVSQTALRRAPGFKWDSAIRQWVLAQEE